MGCGTYSKGYTPRQARFIRQDCKYKVQPGQCVSDICYLFGIPATRWQELVGANLHKPLGEAPYGYKQRCFAELQAGEKLNVPATWSPYNPYPGAVSGVGLQTTPLKPIDGLTVQKPSQAGAIADRLKLFLDALMGTPVPDAVLGELAKLGLSMPSGVTMRDALAVVFSWWPYITWPTPGGAPPPLPTPGMPIPPVDPTLLAKLGAQAVEFLRATGITDGTSPNVQNIPWDGILWNDVPWDVLSTQVLQDLSQAMLGTPLPPYTTPAMPMAGQAPDFLTANWQDEPWAEILNDVEFNDSIVDVLGDPEAVGCIKANPERLKKLNGCPECYKEGTDKFKELLCSSEPADPCQCAAGGGGGGGGGDKESSNLPLIIGGVTVGTLVLGLVFLSGRKS